MKYLFVRILEKCNAHCDMCHYGGNLEGFVFPSHEWIALIDSALYQGVRCIRLTGGEPLIHPNILALVKSAAERGMRVSVITNGHRLESLLEALVEAGLSQVIVSIDSPDPTEHDRLRGIKGLYERALAGLKAAIAADLHTRVNTVCGPRNFRSMPILQNILTELGIGQWELSTLKLERRLDYALTDKAAIEMVTNLVYTVGPSAGKLRPMGKIWWGETDSERTAYLEYGVAPRPTTYCHVVNNVRYLDPSARRLYPCSLLPHRPNSVSLSVEVDDFGILPLSSPKMLYITNWIVETGFLKCTGCSATAAGYVPASISSNRSFKWDY